jgi:hypothetical protein
MTGRKEVYRHTTITVPVDALIYLDIIILLDLRIGENTLSLILRRTRDTVGNESFIPGATLA